MVHKKLKNISVYCNLCTKEISAKIASGILIDKIRKMNELMNIPPITCIEEKDISKMESYDFKEANRL